MSAQPLAASPIPVLFLHGWGLHGGIWSEVREALTGQASTDAPDLPGYGDEPPVSPYDAATLADRLASRCPGPRVLVGWSLGGMVALAWAARQPRQVRALVLVGSSSAFVQRPDWPHAMPAELLATFADDLATDYRSTLLRFLSLQARGGDDARAVIGRLRQSVLARGEPRPETLAEGLELLRTVDLRALVDQVRCPTLIIHGARDSLCPPTAAEWLRERLPQARLALHERAAHAPFLSHPDWFLARLRGFLSEAANG